jgi:gliding motility-associated-like protein
MSNRYQKIKFCLYAFFAFAPFLVQAQINVSVAVKSPTCNGYTDGEAAATVTGGKAPYSYNWSNGQGGQTIYAAAGNYTVTVTDADGKTANNAATIAQPAALVANATAINGVCSDDKSLTASATGGTAPYTYSWRNLTSGASTTGVTLSNPTQGGYFLTITDAKGCTASKFVNVEGALVVNNIVTNVYCNGRGDGSIATQVSGGKLPYSFQWDANGKNATTQGINSLNGGTYTVTVTDGNGCKKTVTSTVIEPPKLLANAVITGQCSGNGTVVLSPSGGIPPYKAMWTHGPTSMTLTNLAPGAYYVCVMDANGCPADTPINISGTGSIGLDLTKEDAACGGVNDGKIIAHVTGGAMGPYTYKWSNGGALTSDNISNLASGTYTLTLVDASGCSETKSITVNNKTTLGVTTTATNSLCGGTTGTASAVTVTGGTAPFTYKWSNNQTSKDVSGLAAGSYNVVVSDAKGCKVTQSVTVGTSGSNITATSLVADAKCGTNNGSVKLTGAGGTAPYTYKYAGGSNQTGSFSNLAAGDYTFTVTDANGCSYTQATSLKNVGAVKAAFSAVPNGCNPDGVNYKFTNTSTGAIAGAKYEWLFTGNRAASTINADAPFNTQTGDARLVTTSAEGCTDTSKQSFNVDVIRLSNIQDTVSTCIGTSVKTSVNTDNTTFAHTYSWTPLSIIESGANTLNPVFKSNVAGNVKAILTVTNSLGCTKTDSVLVNSLAKSALNPSDITFKQDCNTRKIDFKNNNTALGNNYRWVFGDPTNPTAGSTQTAPSYTYAQGGNVTVTLIPTVACFDTLKVTVPVRPDSAVTLKKSNNVSLCAPAAQVLTATTNKTTNKIEWSANKNFTPIAATGGSFNAPAGNTSVYYVRATDANGCASTDSIVVANNELKVTTTTPALALCVGVGKSANITTNAANNVTVVWTPATAIEGSNTVLNPVLKAGSVSSGQIEGLFTNSAGCTAKQVITYSATEVKATVTASDKLVYKDFDVTLNAQPSGTGYTYKWNPTTTATTASFTNKPAVKTTYTVTVTDANGCSSTASVEVDVIEPQCAEPFVYIPTAFSPNDDNTNDKIRVHGEFLTTVEFVIYNRWGEKVFETKQFANGESEGWDGVHANKGVCPDVYGFYVKGTCKNGTEFFKKGNITVLK